MKKRYLPLILLPLLLEAATVDEVVNQTLENNHSLKALENSIEISKQQISLATKWENPILTIGANDLQLNDISARDKEPMQAQFIGITQAFPTNGKLELKEEIAKDDYSISKYQLDEKRLELKSNIYEYIYKIKLLEERLFLYEEFKSNVKEIEKLLKNFYKYSKASQEQIITTQILYDELNLKAQQLKTFLDTSHLKLEELTYKKFDTFEIDTNLKNIKLKKEISSHPKILSFDTQTKKFTTQSKLENAKKISDIKMNLSYFQRDDKYEDYLNFSLAFPLPIYGKENIEVTKAKFKSAQAQNQLEDLKFKFKNQIKVLQKSIDDSITTYNIIEKSILPKYESLQKILESNNSYSANKKIDTNTLIKNQNEIIKYKLKAIDEKDKYFSSLAKSYYFTRIEK
ncbi:hypothetical protein CRV08_07375 [Halarcobacter ebronensis]|uniref:Transporter n=1 Tax=Halarcobacter ebronensis TaxID=1462615 RepID=A0A4Q0YDS6_9BACT|nr:TolC family protein [Halarcobacter ebronensis]RXJ68637.1 hypothetical protein CRV08_07375 [Halarcobacter ebronensis]